MGVPKDAVQLQDEHNETTQKKQETQVREESEVFLQAEGVRVLLNAIAGVVVVLACNTGFGIFCHLLFEEVGQQAVSAILVKLFC